MSTLAAYRSACYQRLGWGTSPAADITTRVDQFINDTVKEILSDKSVQKLRREQNLAFATVSDVGLTALPQAATAIHAIKDTTNRRALDEVSTDWIDARDPGRAFSSSTPIAYAIVGYSKPFTRQPSASGQLTVRSSSASDTTQTAYVEVMTATGYVRAMSVVLTGTSAANIGPADSLKVLDFYISAVGVGEVYLSDAAANELGRIGIGRTRARYTIIELYQKPAGVFTLYADVDLAIQPLVNATDEPLIPEDFDEAVIHGVRKREYQKREKFDLAGACDRDFQKVMNKLRLHTATKTALDAHSRPGFSQLGPMYPSGS